MESAGFMSGNSDGDSDDGDGLCVAVDYDRNHYIRNQYIVG